MSASYNNFCSKNPYQGLINEGSTCYLNSLIQTLFMTPQFRKNVYAYVHNAKKIDNKNSIPYQLQKLFVQLQTWKDKLVTTKGLLKSFQWTQADAFQQHDVQQFCRKLFQAIQIANKKAHWITDLFQGSTMSFVNCGKHLSQKQQIFMDISLPIHNPYTKKQFQSLEECIKEYLKSQKLEDKFHCDACNDKVQVQKGLRINKLPPLLTIQLNRFQLNYQTWQRQKVNTFLYFPEILYMGKFMKKYQEIQISQLPVDLRAKVIVKQKQKSNRTTDFTASNPYQLPKQVPKIKPKRKASDQIQSDKPKVFFFDESDKRQKQQKKLTAEEQKQKNRQILANLKSQKSAIDQKMKVVEMKQLQSIQDDMLFGSGMGFIADSGPIQWNSGNVQKQSQSKKPNYSKNQVQFQHQQQIYDPNKQYPQNTYMLYAVLVHSGGAYGGHYFAYISNGKDWFKFDDSVVRKVDRFQMRKYGSFDKSAHGANAYLLFYRDVKTFKESDPDTIQIPEQLLQKVKNDVQVTKLQDAPDSKKQKRLQQILHGVMIKVIKVQQTPQILSQPNLPLVQPLSFLVQNRHQQTIMSLKQRIKSLFPELQNNPNWRLRRFNNTQDTLHEIYDQNFQIMTLDSLGFRQSMHVAIQTKNQNQEWEQYDAKQILVKVNVWRPGITLVTEKFLKPLKLNISQQAPFSELLQKIRKRCKIQHPVILKRNFSQSNPIQKFSLQQTKKLIQLRFFNGINLYIQQPHPQNKIRWVQQFQFQKYRCLIKYNNPNSQDQTKNCQLYFDTRKTLKQLKQYISTLIQIPIQQFRIKKSRQAVSQLTTYNKKLIDLKFIATQYIYLEKGKSSYGAILIKEGRVQIKQDKIEFDIYEETIIEIQQNMNTVEHLVQKLSSILKIDAKLIRVRQYRAFQFGQIFRWSDSIHRIKDKSLIWERLKNEELSQMKGLQLYLRTWDVLTLQLGQLKQIYVDSSATYEQFAMVLEQQLGMKANKILVWKALSNYVQKQGLFDCQWTEICYIRKQIKQEPLYIMNDGQIIIVKQSEKQYHARVNYTSVGTSTKQKGKQAQLKIVVMAQNSDQQEELIKQAMNASLQQSQQQNQNGEEKSNQNKTQ